MPLERFKPFFGFFSFTTSSAAGEVVCGRNQLL
jgi:hypothetical protein